MATKYLKLGKKASSFFEPSLRLKVQQGVPAAFEGKPTKRLGTAIRMGHVVEIDKATYEKLLKAKPEKTAESEDQGDIFEKMNSNKLVGFYKANYEVSEEDLKAFKKLSVKEQRDFLRDADTPDEEDEDTGEDE